jgi:hypothetical protein
VQISRECTPPYLSTGISNLLQPAQAEVVMGQRSMYLASWFCTLGLPGCSTALVVVTQTCRFISQDLPTEETPQNLHGIAFFTNEYGVHILFPIRPRECMYKSAPPCISSRAFFKDDMSNHWSKERD